MNIYATYCQPYEDRFANYIHTKVNDFNKSTKDYTNSTKKIIEGAPTLIFLLGIALAPSKYTLAIGLATGLISLKNPKIITRDFAGKLLMGFGIYVFATQFFLAMKTCSLLTSGAFLCFAGYKFKFLSQWIAPPRESNRNNTPVETNLDVTNLTFVTDPDEVD